ncbi:dynamin family protein [Anabaena sp. UHCC 0187]|uniref:dynamin family protein n=1 Tax=Anabaena sp. UHCC 0187 TaxID=2590018 RepID=UPI0014472836|nr:dynamin family protein [Anabaena sp. UHCC 0187]MTJ11757.1 dynamin family protein [Anabaena sp. UHCC 0187]
MSSKQFQSAHGSIYKLGTRLLKYIEEIRQSRLSEGDDTKSLESVENNINKALNALKEQKYQVAVIAAMKAGKSTFLNAVIGADVLASETAACTICRTDVRHIPSNQDSRLLEYQAGARKPIVIAEGDEGEIQHKFLLRTRKIRETGNPDNTIRFEIEHHIEAISGLSSLDGFTLVDTPGPNEWESANFNTVALKQTALEALRTCNAILFVLNYASYKDSAVSDLFKEVLENRQEILEQEKGKIYFILNKVDQKTERDREIEDVIQDLQRELSNFGFPNPIIYPASSRQGLLAKLIQQQKATESQTKDFKKFFSARYAIEDEEGTQTIPAPRKIAPQALIDSGIPTIQETVIETITKNAGWNLLSDVLAIIDKSAKTVEDTLNTKISGWEMDIASLKKKIEEYKKRSDNARSKVENVKKSVDRQKQILINGFSQGIDIFAEETKAEIQYQIDQIAESQSTKLSTTQKVKAHRSPIMKTSQNIDWGNIGDIVADVGGGILELFSKRLGSIFKAGVKGGTSLLSSLSKETPQVFNSSSNDDMGEIQKNSDPYIIRVRSKNEAEKISKTINESCASLIQKFWLDTQDTLVRDGTNIREILALKIENDIQEISNELSDYLGKELQVKLNINKIQFPKFEFPGIDARIKQQQGVFKRTKTEEKKKCCSEETYTVSIPSEEKGELHEVYLRETTKLIHQKIDEQVLNNRELLQRVIEKQIADDFKKAEQQINEYIKKFQDDFDSLLKKRETKEAESDKIINSLNLQKEKLNEYLQELILIRQSLNSWKP